MKLPGRALWDVFADGARVVSEDGTVEPARTLEAGELVLPTGRVVASDPFLSTWNQPFSVRVEPGAYLVLLAIVRHDVAAVLVSFGGDPPVSWQPADPPTFGVDAAAGCLMDYKVNRYLRRKAEAGRYDHYWRMFRKALDEADGKWANSVIDPGSGANVVLFRTWGGDCYCASYFGYDADGSVTCLVTDMYLSHKRVAGVEPAA